MSSISINGKNYLPDDFKKLDLKGKDPESFLKENESIIKNNFKDEIYAISKDDLYVAEFKSMPQADIKSENISFVDLPDSKVVLVDNEQDKHTISKVNLIGIKNTETEKLLLDKLGIKSGDNLSHDDIISKFNNLKEQIKNNLISVDIFTNPIKDSKNGESELNIKVVEIPKNVKFGNLKEEDSNKFKEFFKNPLTKDNIEKGITEINNYFKNNSEKMLISNPSYNIDSNSNLNIEINTVSLPKNINLNLSKYNSSKVSFNQEDQKNIQESFVKPLTPDNIQKGLTKLEEIYNKKGQTIINPDITLNGENIDINISSTEIPTKISIDNPEVFKEKDIIRNFKKPLNIENIRKGVDKVKNMYKDAGYVLNNDGVQVELSGKELKLKVDLVRYGSVEVYGNEKTKSKTISREFGNLEKGKPVNLKDLEKGSQRVKDTENFKSVNYKLTTDINGDIKTNIKVEEQKSNDFSVYGGYGNNDGLFAGGSVTFKNINGEGNDLSLNTELGTKKLSGSVTYKDPWFMENKFDRKISMNSTLYIDKINDPESSQLKFGSMTSFDIPLGENKYDSKWMLSPSLRTEGIKIDKEFSASGKDYDVLVMPKVKIGYTNFDSIKDPREGHKFGTSIGVGTGSATFGQLDVGYIYLKPLRDDKKLVLNMGVNAGIQTNDSPYYEKYSTLNTYPSYGLPQDGKNKANYYAIGSANLEYHVWGPLSLVAGTTIGGVGEKMDSVGIGAGVKVNMMGIPLTVTAGTNYDTSSKERSNSININVLKMTF